MVIRVSFFGIKVCVFCVFLENEKMDLRYFQGLGENTCLLQLLKSATSSDFDTFKGIANGEI